MKFSLAVIAAAFVLAVPASATPLEDKETALKAAMKAELEAKKEPNARAMMNPQMNTAYAVAALDQFLTQVDNPAYGQNIDPQITQMLAGFSSDAVQKAAKDFLDELHKERKDKADAAAAELKTELDHAKDVINAAKKPEDLDDLLVELQKFQGGRFNGGYGQDNQPLLQQLSATFDFTKQWQNYLFHVANGQTSPARADLENLSQNNIAVGIIPRSKILALTSPAVASPDAKPVTDADAQAAQKIVDGIQTLDDMAPALVQLRALNGNNQTVRQFTDTLSKMEDTYLNFKAGLPSNGNFTPLSNGLKVSVKASTLLAKLQMTSMFDTYTGPVPAADETPLAYVDRVKADAGSREDWGLFQKALMAHSSLTREPSNGYFNATANEAAGIDSLITATNQVAAQQFASAVLSYQTALKAANPNLPAKLIGDKLAAIQHDHPAEYEEGMKQFNLPPPVRYLPMYPQTLPGMPPRGIVPAPGVEASPAAPTPTPVAAPVPSPVPAPAIKAPAATLRLPQ